eukprot:jgi/Botrbrau1/17059/Bobra.0258s0002.1
MQSFALLKCYLTVLSTTSVCKSKIVYVVSRLKRVISVSKARMLSGSTFFLDEFAVRQWDDPKFPGTRIPSQVDKAEFVRKIHHYHEQGASLVDGYAPFCKHIFVPNFAGCRATAIKITADNRNYLESGYSNRRPEELPVLSRWFPLENVGPLHEAKFLDIILYSRQQLLEEYKDLPTEAKGHPDSIPQVPWGIISIKAQDEDYEIPMSPITMMRNALGRSEGGSGVPLDRAKYQESVDYWQQHALIQ